MISLGQYINILMLEYIQISIYIVIVSLDLLKALLACLRTLLERPSQSATIHKYVCVSIYIYKYVCVCIL